MVKQNWIESKISQLEADRLEDNWSKKREEQLQYLLRLYRTGEYNTYSVKQINEILCLINTKFSK